MIAGQITQKGHPQITQTTQIKSFAACNCCHAADGRETPGPPAACGHSAGTRTRHLQALLEGPAGL